MALFTLSNLSTAFLFALCGACLIVWVMLMVYIMINGNSLDDITTENKPLFSDLERNPIKSHPKR